MEFLPGGKRVFKVHGTGHILTWWLFSVGKERVEVKRRRRKKRVGGPEQLFDGERTQGRNSEVARSVIRGEPLQQKEGKE